MRIEVAKQNEEERDLSTLRHGGGVVIFVSDLGDVDGDPVSEVKAEVNSIIFPEFRKGDVLEYEDCFNLLKVKIAEVLSDDINVKYKLRVVKVLKEASLRKKGEVFVYEHAKGFGGRQLKRFGDEF